MKAALIVWRIALTIAIIAGALMAFSNLAGMRTRPPQADRPEIRIPVDTTTVKAIDHPISLHAFGTVSARTRTEIRPQISGRVMTMHPNLHPGMQVQKDDVIATIDDRDFHLLLAQTRADQARIGAEIARLEQDRLSTRATLEVRRSALAVSEQELARQVNLVESANIGTQAQVDRARQAVLADQERIAGYQATLAALPKQMAVLEAQKKALDVAAETHTLNIARCTIKAPFTGRVLREQLEPGDLVGPTSVLAVLVDDRVRELRTSLDYAACRRWLRFTDVKPPGWLPAPEKVQAEARWVDDAAAIWHPVTVDRIAEFSPADRQLALLLLLPERSPLVDGMFCEVRIPGRSASGVFEIQRSALNGDRTVYTLQENGDKTVLERREIEPVFSLDSSILVRGLQDGDELVISRIAAPAPGRSVVRRESQAVSDGMEEKVPVGE